MGKKRLTYTVPVREREQRGGLRAFAGAARPRREHEATAAEGRAAGRELAEYRVRGAGSSRIGTR